MCCLNLSIVKWRLTAAAAATTKPTKYKVFQSLRIDQFHQIDWARDTGGEGEVEYRERKRAVDSLCNSYTQHNEQLYTAV